ncbi:uncharacterized protein LOC126622360 isoform X1 [Malus sylvestris]|uniref:uncharacterized protein LOC126622360 isoform X1 n=1 Tax=Malus sylvestris TaxID=3752 RepID=UPI0021AC5C11|nr:uncharacterized protein LOC126622360 isoform X1 [Malus sylvestris]
MKLNCSRAIQQHGRPDGPSSSSQFPMKTLISQFTINCSNPQSSPSAFIFHFPSLSRESQNFLHFSRRKWSCNPGTFRFSSVGAKCASESASYGGWDDFRLAGGSGPSGESNQFRQFLNSIGIDDKKHVFVFLLGLVCAFAISRVRVTSIVVFPASILVFAIGFSFGFVRGGGVGEVRLIGDKRRGKEENLIDKSDKLRKLVEIVDDFHVKVGNLKYDIQKAIDCREITVTDLERYVKVIESIGSSVLNARNVADGSVENLGKFSVELAESKKASKRKKEPAEIGYELFQYIGGLFNDKLADSKSGRVKNNVKRETTEKVVDDQSQGNGSMPPVKGVVLGSVHSQEVYSKSGFDEAGNGRTKVALENNKMSSEEADGGPNRSTARKVFNYQNNGLQSNGHVSMKMDASNHAETWESPESVLDSVDFGVRTKQMDDKSNGVYRPSNIRGKNVNGTYEFHSRGEKVNRKEDSQFFDHLPGHENELPSLSSSLVSDDILFDRYVTEANDLLKQAKEFIRVRHNEERAEIVLYRSAKLLSKAIAMKPMSLLAVGQLGNTCLLHGELKLRISRELRMHLLRSDPLSVEKWIRMQDKVTSKDDIASVLINVCEECEELLVEAGRRYRMALSIDGNDVRALYNWGLALTFRAQLIADIGPEAAFDADELFLAAIDKFDAMMSKGNVYAPDALFRWGVALQQRSRLRPSNGKEKVKLLEQAKRLYEDALDMDSNNVQVREALSSCMLELGSRRLYS